MRCFGSAQLHQGSRCNRPWCACSGFSLEISSRRQAIRSPRLLPHARGSRPHVPQECALGVARKTACRVLLQLPPRCQGHDRDHEREQSFLDQSSIDVAVGQGVRTVGAAAHAHRGDCAGHRDVRGERRGWLGSSCKGHPAVIVARLCVGLLTSMQRGIFAVVSRSNDRAFHSRHAALSHMSARRR